MQKGRTVGAPNVYIHIAGRQNMMTPRPHATCTRGSPGEVTQKYKQLSYNEFLPFLNCKARVAKWIRRRAAIDN